LKACTVAHAVIVVALWGCATSGGPAGGTAAPADVTFRAGYYDEDNHPVSGSSLPQTVSLLIRVIAGDFAGTPNNEVILQLSIPIGSEAKLAIGDQLRKIDALAAPLTRDAINSGIVVTPPETRFARFATLVLYPNAPKGVGWSSFRGSEPNELLVLAYFDRPCTVSGTARRYGYATTFNVVVPSAGVHFLRMSRDGGRDSHATWSATPEQVVLAISDTGRPFWPAPK
jgi:hypothetical protein